MEAILSEMADRHEMRCLYLLHRSFLFIAGSRIFFYGGHVNQDSGKPCLVTHLSQAETTKANYFCGNSPPTSF